MEEKKREIPVIFESPGATNYGMKHWKDHHLDDWKKKDFVQKVLSMLRSTIWNPLAVMKNTFEKKGNESALHRLTGNILQIYGSAGSSGFTASKTHGIRAIQRRKNEQLRSAGCDPTSASLIKTSCYLLHQEATASVNKITP